MPLSLIVSLIEAKKEAPPVDYEGETIQDALAAATLEELDEFEVLLHTDKV